MRVLLDDLTDYNRKRLGVGLYIVLSEIDLRDVLEDEVQQLRNAHLGRQVELEMTGDLRGRWDEGRLHQVVGNLVGNALKYGRAGSTVRVTAEAVDDEVRFAVENEGEPITPSELAGLFDPLRRGPDRPPEEGSLGLGLFICDEVVKAHGGEINATSIDGVTAFTVRLPRTRAA